jgi:hypothetical protein
MTWIGDENAKPAGNERQKLLDERAKIVKQVEALGIRPLPNATQSAKIGRMEDLTNLAKKIKALDKKLGRSGGTVT